MTATIIARDLAKAYPGRRLLREVTLTAHPGERIGVVGDNGSGKSTLLRILAGTEYPDEGEVTVHAGGGLGHLDQVLALPEDTSAELACAAPFADLHRLAAALRSEERALATGSGDLDRYGELLGEFERRGGYTVEATISATLAAVGLAELDPRRPLGQLSGGERARLALAAVLAADPELLLLDEPTNHLDETMLSWLESRLCGHRGTVVVVSHDRLFLERVATALVEVDGDTGRVRRHGGGYAAYLAETAAARVRWEQEHLRWREEVNTWTEWARTTAYRVAPGRPIPDHNKCKYNGDGRRVQQSITTRTRSAAQRLARLRADPVPAPPRPLRFTATPATTASEFDGPLATLSGISVPGRCRIDRFTVGQSERVLVSGANGAGKSTLLWVLAGGLEVEAGTLTRQGRIGYLPQETPGETAERTVLWAYAEGRPGTIEEHTERLLSLGLFRERDLHLRTCSLSIGQQRKLQLARLLADPADLLLLDEPTNHLAPALVEQLEAALARYPGAVVVVSHDRLFRRRFAGREVSMTAPGGEH